MNRKFMVHWMGNIRNGDFYDEKKRRYSPVFWFPCSLQICCSPAAARTADEPVTKSGFYFNTVISVSIYEKGSEELLDDCFALAQKYEGYFSNTIPDSDISKINDAGGSSRDSTRRDDRTS